MTEEYTTALLTATYSPEDNKLRLYSDTRLDSETYQMVKEAGFRWAPKQELFVAPMWTPQREDLLVELCGEIGDEDTSLVDRAEDRAERFSEYSDKRKADYESAHAGVKAITKHIPFGQPILVGHHSEKRARKDAQRIENGMKKAVTMWDRAEYWIYRAKGAISAAKYKERPDVRARRIKKIEAAQRKSNRTKAEAKQFVAWWSNPEKELTMERSRAIANRDFGHFKFPLSDYPRELPASQYEGYISLWSALDGGIITPEQARDLTIPQKKAAILWAERWIEHYENRLNYEKAMLEAQGGSDLLKPKKRPKLLPLLNYPAPEGLSVENMYHKGEFSIYPQVEMTKKEYAAIYKDDRGTVIIEGTHRVKVVFSVRAGGYDRSVVFLTDSKVHKRPEKPTAPLEVKDNRPVTPRGSFTLPEENPDVVALREQVKEGVTVVSTPQLFPTPSKIADKMAEYADIIPGSTVLEPSAGTGSLIKAIRKLYNGKYVLTAVEINNYLCDRLRNIEQVDDTRHADFLQCNGDLGTFDRIIMNPPFKNGEDIKHINHAMSFLKPGGKLIALCANGLRQQKAFQGICDHWEDLPTGSFAEQGTNVNTALFVLSPS